MEGGGKRRRRLRLIRYAAALLKARPGQIPEEHGDACDCVQCEANRHLDAGDWHAVRFFGLVRDQVENLLPMGDQDGKVHLVPRLDAWEAALRIYDVPREEWPDLVDHTRALFHAVSGGERDPEPWMTPEFRLKAEEIGSDG